MNRIFKLGLIWWKGREGFNCSSVRSFLAIEFKKKSFKNICLNKCLMFISHQLYIRLSQSERQCFDQINSNRFEWILKQSGLDVLLREYSEDFKIWIKKTSVSCLANNLMLFDHVEWFLDLFVYEQSKIAVGSDTLLTDESMSTFHLLTCSQYRTRKHSV